MKISKLYVYPIKSLRPTKLSESELTHLGFRYDRRFMLLKVISGENGDAPTLENLHISSYPEMGLFQTAIEMPKTDLHDGKVIVKYHPPVQNDMKNSFERSESIAASTSGSSALEIPLEPDTRALKSFTITMHQSPTIGYDMGPKYNDWFSACFGYPVVLAYLGDNTRGVLGNLAPDKHYNVPWWRKWLQGVTLKENNKVFPWWLFPLFTMLWVLTAVSLYRARIEAAGTKYVLATSFAAGSVGLLWIAMNLPARNRLEARIGFADCAPFLVISQTSVDDVSSRLAEDEDVDLTKFRPNIVVSGADAPFEEDFWAELAVGSHGETGSGSERGNGRVRLLLTGNCVRCQSLNVDFATGKMGTGESGKLLKKLMKDRRVDKGARFSPVFGRYSFLGRESVGEKIRVGDEVRVVKRASEHTITDWPGLAY